MASIIDYATMIVKSYAKINVSLAIKGQRDDGYHLLEMLTLPLELHDIIEIERSPYFNDTFVTCDDVELNKVHHNLCAKAIEALRSVYHFKDNFSIHIHKVIPFAAGLGGGSSNAAVVMLTLNKILRLGASLDDLWKIGLEIGADVPFFLLDKPALVTGIGEKVEPIAMKKSYECLIVKPIAGLSTKDVFAVADSFPHANIDSDKVKKALETGDDALLVSSFGNDLYLPATSLLPEVKTLVESLKADGFPLSAMTGSGSAVFALSSDPRKVKDMARKYEKNGYIVAVTKTLK